MNRVERALKDANVPLSRFAAIRLKNNFSAGLIQKPDVSHYFGEKSMFFKRIMEDGYIYNPYVHPRYLQGDYRKAIFSSFSQAREFFLNDNDERNLIYDLAKTYFFFPDSGKGFYYLWKQIKSSLNKIILLEKVDRGAYLEYSHWYTIKDTKAAIKCLFGVLKRYSYHSYILDRIVPALIEELNNINTYPELLELMEKAEKDISARSYTDFYRMWNGWGCNIREFMGYTTFNADNEQYYGENVTAAFKPFIKRGLYLSLKWELMFLKVDFRKIYGKENYTLIEELRSDLINDTFSIIDAHHMYVSIIKAGILKNIYTSDGKINVINRNRSDTRTTYTVTYTQDDLDGLRFV